MKKHSNAVKQSRRLNKEQTKNLLLDSFVYNDNKEDLSTTGYTIKDYHEAIEIIKECENIIKINTKIIGFKYKQGKIFKKFKEDAKFKNLVEQFRINKSTIIFKINIVKLVDKYKKMLTSSVMLNFLKSYFKDIKSICKENPELFSWMFILITFKPYYLFFFLSFCISRLTTTPVSTFFGHLC